MKQAVRAVVIKDDALLVMHRNKFGSEYYTLVGGGVELDESLEAALYRELQEETSVTVANPRLVFVEDAGDMYGKQYVYLCDYAGGEVALAANSEEAHINSLGQNLYTPMWLPLTQLPDVAFVSPSLKKRIVQAIDNGWPEEAEQINHIEAKL